MFLIIIISLIITKSSELRQNSAPGEAQATPRRRRPVLVPTSELKRRPPLSSSAVPGEWEAAQLGHAFVGDIKGTSWENWIFLYCMCIYIYIISK